MIIGSREIDVYPFNENSLFMSVGVMYIRRFKVNSIVRCQHFYLNIQLDASVAIIVDSAVRLHVCLLLFLFIYLPSPLTSIDCIHRKKIYVTGVKKRDV